MILHVNCIANPVTRASFDREVVTRLAVLVGMPIRTIPLDDPLPDPAEFSHLVLNGSELSAAKENPRDDALIDLIRAFADAGRPILGICYGHQMIARAFGGECRRAAEPEFGWKTVELESSPHFEGIEPPFVSAHSHFDEVPAPPPGFEVIARTDRCAVQAMATDGILSIQFHPEMTWERGQAMFADNVATGAVAAEDLSNDLRDPAEVKANDRIFTNFFGVNP